MGKDQRDPPKTAHELRDRYAAGERDFRGADLRADCEADLSGADLREADLSGADLTYAKLIDAKLRGANLNNAKLNNAKLTEADLSDAKLRGANLSAMVVALEIWLIQFVNTDLSGANLSGADLWGADLWGANLSGANLSGANLSGANLNNAKLGDAKFSDACLDHTVLTHVDLTTLCDADPPVVHLGPSIVDHRSILRSLRAPGLKDFLVRAGMPEVFAEYMVDCARSLQTDVFRMLQSTFISYGAPDEAFARKLYEALHRNGVTTFFFAEHAEPGEKLHRMMRRGVNEHDRVILVCSKDSLDRKGVLNELEEILAREARDGGASYLIPIRLDGYVFSGWKPPNADVAQAVRDRVVADFEGADSDDGKFQVGLQKLIRALRKKTIE